LDQSGTIKSPVFSLKAKNMIMMVDNNSSFCHPPQRQKLAILESFFALLAGVLLVVDRMYMQQQT